MKRFYLLTSIFLCMVPLVDVSAQSTYSANSYKVLLKYHFFRIYFDFSDQFDTFAKKYGI